MKVCTDSCLFGAWLADRLKARGGNLLDIGTGTGLLSLMLAQESRFEIDAVEVDDETSREAAENVAGSPWLSRISVHHGKIQQYPAAKNYDVLMSNPPYYETNLKSPQDKRNLALHSADLSLEQLFTHAYRLSSATTELALLLPYARTEEAKARAAQMGWKPQEQVNVRQTEKHSFFRVMLLFGRTEQPAREMEMIIKENGDYSAAFKQLLAPYYLAL